MQTLTAKNQIVAEIDDYIRKNGNHYPSWYVGIAADPRNRLFNDHNANETNGYWIYRDCGTEAMAREVEEHFLRLGCKGGGGGGGYQTRYVYAYKITATTRE